MKKDIKAYLYDVDNSISNVLAFIGHKSFDEYNKDLMVKAAVERQFEIIGEILRRMSLDFPEIYAKIRNARRIIDFRNVISHGYDLVDDQMVYDIAKNQLLDLRADIKKL